jgi:hypothetical protein
MQIRGGYTVIASGGYGCTIRIDETTVGKILFSDPIWKEYDENATDDDFMRVQTSIRALDPDETYFITIRDIRYLPYDAVKDCVDNWLARMKDFRRKREEPRVRAQKQFPVYIQTAVDSDVHPETWTFEDFDHALTGLKRLHAHDLTHNDVHKGNFGMHNGHPVYLDMDSAWYARPLEIVRNRRYFFPLYNTVVEDIVQFRNFCKEYEDP